MSDYTGNLMEDYLPNVKFGGIRTNKDISVGDSSTVILPSTTTIGGSSVVALGDITSSSTTASAFTVTNTGVFTGTEVVSFVADSLTSGTLFTMSVDGMTTGTALSITSTGTLVTTGNLLTLTASSATTAAGLLRVTGDGLTTGSLAVFSSNSSDASTRTIVSIVQDHASAAASTALAVTQDAAAGTGIKINTIGTSGSALYIDNASGVQADNTGLVFLDHGGNMAAGSNIIRIAPTGTPVETSVAIELVGASKVIQGLVIDTDAATSSANVFTGGGVRSADTAVLEVVADAAASNADSQVVRINQSSATGANVPLGIIQADVSEPIVLFESSAGSGQAVDLTNTTPAAIAGSILISVNGTDYRLPVYVAAGWSA